MSRNLGDKVVGSGSPVQNVGRDKKITRLEKNFRDVDNPSLRQEILNAFGNEVLSPQFFAKGFNGQDPYLTGDAFGLGHRNGVSAVKVVVRYRGVTGKQSLPEGARTEDYVNNLWVNSYYSSVWP